MSEINVFNKQSHKLDQTVQGNTVSLTKASVVVVHINLDDIVEVKKDKNNAVLVIESGEEITLVNYFNYGNINTSNSLVLQDDQNKLIWAKFTDANGKVLENIEYGQIEEIGMLFEPSSGFSPWLWAAVPVVGAGVYLLSKNNEDKSGSDHTPVIAAPKFDPINAKDLIKGKAEPDSIVTITFPNGEKKITTTDKSGNWSIENPGLKQGDSIEAIATNKNGNTSEIAKQLVDAIAPTLKISVSDINLSSGKEVNITFTFSEVIKGFDLKNLTVTGGVLSNFVTKDNKIWTAVFTQKGLEDPSIKVIDESYVDLANNKGKGDTLSKDSGGFKLDLVAPSVEITVSDLTLGKDQAVTITFKFSESVRGFSLDDMSVMGGKISDLKTTDGITWLATFTQEGSAAPSIKVTENSYVDLAGNQGKGGILDQINGNWVLEPASTQSSFLVSAPIALEVFLVEDQPAPSTQQEVPDEYSLPIQIDDLLVAAGPTELWVEHDLMLLKQQNDSSMTLQRPSDPFALDMYHATTAITIALLPQHDLI